MKLIIPIFMLILSLPAALIVCLAPFTATYKPLKFMPISRTSIPRPSAVRRLRSECGAAFRLIDHDSPSGLERHACCYRRRSSWRALVSKVNCEFRYTSDLSISPNMTAGVFFSCKISATSGLLCSALVKPAQLVAIPCLILRM